MLNIMQVSVSPVLIEEVMSLLPKDLSEIQKPIEAELWLQEIISNAKAFVDKYKTLPFFNREPFHEFTGITIRNNFTKKVEYSFNHILRYVAPDLWVGPLREVKLDDNYPVRKVMAEATFPEYQEDMSVDFYERN